MIIVKNRELLIPNNERYIGTTYDTDTENRVFQVPRFSQRGVDLAALTFRLDIQYANEAYDTVILDKEVGEAYIILIWRITAATLQVPGTMYIGLRAVDGEATVKWSSFSAAMYAERHLNTPGNYGGSLTEIEQMEQDHQYMKGVVDELKANLDYAHDAEAWATGNRNGEAVPSTDEAYHNNAKYYKDQAASGAGSAKGFSLDAEAWAKGTREGTAVTSGQDGYHDNAKYYAEQAAATVADTNTRFNNAVAAVTVDTEVQDARVGADGTTYTVLKSRLDAENSLLKSHLGELEDEVYKGIDNIPVSLWEKGGLKGTDATNDSYRSGCRCRTKTFISYPVSLRISCLNSTTGVTGYWKDSSDVIHFFGTLASMTILIPAFTPFRIYVDGNFGSSTVTLDISTILSGIKVEQIEDTIPDIIEKMATDQNLEDITGIRPINFVLGKYITLNSSTADISSPGENVSWRYAVVSCVAGDRFTISATGGIAPRAYGFLDASGNVLTRADESVTLNKRVITAPENAVTLVINDNSGSESYAGEITTNPTLNEKIEAIRQYQDTDVLKLFTWVINGISIYTGANTNSTKAIRSNYIRIQDYAHIHIDIDDGYTCDTYLYDASLACLTVYGSKLRSTRFADFDIPSNAVFLRISVHKTVAEDATLDYVNRITCVGISKLKQTITDISDQINLPDYYFDNDYLPQRCLTAQKSVGNDVSFGYISDVHTGDSSRMSMRVAKYIGEHTSVIPFMIFGGDVLETNTATEDGAYEQAMAWQKMMADFGSHHVYQCRGNHDYLSKLSDQSAWNGTYALCRNLAMNNQPDGIIAAPGEFYYYFDVAGTQTRIIVLDQYAISDTPVFTGYIGLDRAEYEWLLDTALNCDNKNVIIVAHQPMNRLAQSHEDYPGALKLLSDVISAFATHSRVTGSYGAVTIDHDFSENTSDLVCVLSGHTHVDYFGARQSYLTIGITCDALYSTDGYGRLSETVEQGAFDILNLDTSGHTVNCIRIGAGYDRLFHYAPTAPGTLASVLTGTLTWTSSDDTVATVSDGVVTGVASGSCGITATDEDGNKEIWLVTVS